MWAACLGMCACVRVLVEEGGADVHARDKEGNDVASIAVSGGNVEVCEFLFTYTGAHTHTHGEGAGEGEGDGGPAGGDAHTHTHTHGGAGRRRIDIDSMEHNKAGARLLYIACRYGHLPLVKWLVVEGGASVTGRSTESEVMAHHAAAAYGHLEVCCVCVCVCVLLEQACKQSLTNTPIYTRIHTHTYTHTHTQVLQFLIQEGGAPVEATAADRMTCLHIAAEEGHVEVVKWLVEEVSVCVCLCVCV